jgi:hypothetical protein
MLKDTKIFRSRISTDIHYNGKKKKTKKKKTNNELHLVGHTSTSGAGEILIRGYNR